MVTNGDFSLGTHFFLESTVLPQFTFEGLFLESGGHIWVGGSTSDGGGLTDGLELGGVNILC